MGCAPDLFPGPAQGPSGSPLPLSKGHISLPTAGRIFNKPKKPLGRLSARVPPVSIPMTASPRRSKLVPGFLIPACGQKTVGQLARGAAHAPSLFGRRVADGSPVCELLPPVRLTEDSQNNVSRTSPITEATSSLRLLSQNARGWWLRNYTKEMCCSQFQSPKSPRSGCQQIWCLGRVCFWVHRGLCSACVLTWQSPGAIWVLFNKGPDPMKEVPALMTQVTSPRPHLQIASHKESDFNL